MAAQLIGPPDPQVVIVKEGPPGPPGKDGKDATLTVVGEGFEYTRSTPSDIWVIIHNLGFTPSGWLVYDTDGGQHEPLILSSTAQSTVLKFTDPIAGTATGS